MFPYYSFFLADQLQALGYPISGTDDELHAGHRRYNFGWYRVADAAKLKQMCLDDHGREYEFGVPPPLVRRDLIAQMRADAEGLLPPQYLDCLQHIDQPFFTPVYDFCSPSWFSAAWHWWAMRRRRHVRTSVLASPKPRQRRRRWQKRFRITITSTGLLLPITPCASRLVNASSRTRVSSACSSVLVLRPMTIAGSRNCYRALEASWIGSQSRISSKCDPNLRRLNFTSLGALSEGSQL